MESKVSEGGLNVTLTIRLLMHGKVQGRDRGGEGRHAHRRGEVRGRERGGEARPPRGSSFHMRLLNSKQPPTPNDVSPRTFRD